MASPTESNQAPEVSPSDLRAVWTLMQNLQAHGQPGESTAIDIRTYRSVCSPDADAQAVWTRTLILQIMNHVMHGWSDHSNMDKVFEVAARFPMTIMQPGVQYDQPPFDVREFMKQIAAR